MLLLVKLRHLTNSLAKANPLVWSNSIAITLRSGKEVEIPMPKPREKEVVKEVDGDNSKPED